MPRRSAVASTRSRSSRLRSIERACTASLSASSAPTISRSPCPSRRPARPASAADRSPDRLPGAPQQRFNRRAVQRHDQAVFSPRPYCRTYWAGFGKIRQDPPIPRLPRCRSCGSAPRAGALDRPHSGRPDRSGQWHLHGVQSLHLDGCSHDVREAAQQQASPCCTQARYRPVIIVPSVFCDRSGVGFWGMPTVRMVVPGVSHYYIALTAIATNCRV